MADAVTACTLIKSAHYLEAGLPHAILNLSMQSFHVEILDTQNLDKFLNKDRFHVLMVMIWLSHLILVISQGSEFDPRWSHDFC